MTKKYIVIPEDGATNIKVEVLDFETLSCVVSFVTETPTKIIRGQHYNATTDEFAWFDSCIAKLPRHIKNNIVVIAPVARGASGGLIDANNKIIDAKNNKYTLAYTHPYPEIVEQKFKDLAGSEQQFYQETGSILHFPGGLTLIKRLLFEALERPEIFKKAQGFATYNILMAGHFLGDDYLKAIKKAGNEHTYWMCHTGARDINVKPGTPSKITAKIPRFFELVPKQTSHCYHILDTIPTTKADQLKISRSAQVIPGGHDTALSHLPVISSYHGYFPYRRNKTVIHVDAGTWTLCARLGGRFSSVPKLGYEKGFMAQGTVDGKPTVTSIYGGGNDFKYIKSQVEAKKIPFTSYYNISLLEKVVTEKNCFILPNINPYNYGTGPFPTLKGKIINQDHFFNAKTGEHHIIIALTTACTMAYQINLIAKKKSTPIVLSAGGANDPYLGKLLNSITRRKVYLLRADHIASETTALGAGIVGKAAFLGIHPYEVDLFTSNIRYELLEPLPRHLREKIREYANKLLTLIQQEI